MENGRCSKLITDMAPNDRSSELCHLCTLSTRQSYLKSDTTNLSFTGHDEKPWVRLSQLLLCDPVHLGTHEDEIVREKLDLPSISPDLKIARHSCSARQSPQ